MKTKPKNVAELTSDVVSVWHELRNRQLTGAEAKQMLNAAGKAISGVKTQLEFAKINKQGASEEVMEFVEVD